MKKNATENARFGFVLGTRLDVTNYADALVRLITLLEKEKACAVAAANTHLVSEAKTDGDFAEVLRSFDMVLPDGMPLVWALRLDGHKITDRVYGPYFMTYVLQKGPLSMSHYFFGSTTECLSKLTASAQAMNPNIRIAGTLSPPFGAWDESMEDQMIASINNAHADCVWVALGGVRQETWIAKNRHRFRRGVFLAIGDAFPLVAGMRDYAPEWIQRLGMTWFYRLIQEPRRLLPRYIRYNSRFITFFLLDRLKRVYQS